MLNALEREKLLKRNGNDRQPDGMSEANLQRLHPRRGASNAHAWPDSHLELQISYLFVNLFAGRFVKAVPELHRSESGDICDGAYGYAGRAGI